jgi:hypothetical protein
MAMEGKDLALLGAIGVVGYFLYKNYQSGGQLLLPTTIQANTQTTAATTAGGATVVPESGNVVVQPTPIVISFPGQQPITTGPVKCPPPCPGPNTPPGYMCPQYMIAGCPNPTGYAYGVMPPMKAQAVLTETPSLSLAGFGGPLYGGFGSISPSVGFGIRARGNIAATGWERRRATTSFMVS